jgi:hypothetical protein
LMSGNTSKAPDNVLLFPIFLQRTQKVVI